MGQVIQMLPHSRMTVCVTFNGSGENEVIVEDLPTGEPVFRASSRNDPATESRVWQAVNDSDRPRAYRILARRKDARVDPAHPWVNNADRLLFGNHVARVIGYENDGDEAFNDAVATVVWH